MHGNAKQHLARAVIEPNVTTALHKHLYTQELYHITSGTGRMTLGDEVFAISSADARSFCHPETHFFLAILRPTLYLPS